MGNEKVKCTDCDKWFRDRFNSWRHYLRIHVATTKTNKKSKTENPKPVCPECGHIFYKGGNLKRHLNICKKKLKPPSSERYEFIDNHKFEEWKCKVESETCARFVRKNHYKLQDGGSKTQYNCHRSGFFKSTGKNIRRIKSLGTNKIDGKCPAKIIAIHSAEGKVEALFFPKHEGHGMELEKMTLSKVERAHIAEQIANRIPFHEILQNVKQSSDPQFQRLKLLTKKDLCNISKEFHINTTHTLQIKNNVPCSYEDLAVDFCVNNFVQDNESELDINKQPRTEIDLEKVVSDALGSCCSEDGPPLLAQPSHLSLENDNCSPPLTHHPSSSSQAALPEELLRTITLSFSCDGNPQDIAIVQVPSHVQLSQNHINEAAHCNETMKRIEDFKEEMRNKFEEFLNSIKTEDQLEYARKWMNSFSPSSQ